METYGPPASIYRLVKTNAPRRNFKVERWNRFAGRWQFDGYQRARRYVENAVRYGIALWGDPT